MEISTEDLLSLDDAAQALGISKPTLYRFLSAGTLRGIKVGRQWRFRGSDLKEYMERSPLSIALPHTTEIEAEVRFFEEQVRAIGHDLPKDDPENDKSPAEQEALLLVRRILQHAILLKASDIHIEPVQVEETSVVLVRYRIDGKLQEIRRIPESAREAVAASFKTAADLNVDEKKNPQYRRMPFKFLGQPFHIHVSVIPAITGEDIVMRILAPSAILIGLDKIGLSVDQMAQIERIIQHPSGFMIFTGPAGSGKTTTLYACLLRVVSPQLKLLTVEDPVAIPIPYATQIQVDKRSELSFVRALREFRRHDPDIIYISDIRDRETATVIAEFALTGHAVFFNLHTLDAAGAFRRLGPEGAGIESYALASAVVGVVAQRLARKLCPACKKAQGHIDPVLMNTVRGLASQGGYEVPDDAVFYTKAGCDLCGNKGYKGRIGLYEILEMNDEIAACVMREGTTDEIRQIIRQNGTPSVFADGIRKAVEGLVSIEEVMSVTFPLE